jgi:hypothetical protein
LTAWFDILGVIALLGLALYVTDSHTRRVALRDLAKAGAHVWFFSGMLHDKAFIFDWIAYQL